MWRIIKLNRSVFIMHRLRFPKKWTATDILKAGEYVAKLNDYENLKDGVAVYGMYKGVKVGIMKTDGKIATIFPCLEQHEN